MPPLQAALKGAEQIGFTIISLTFSLIAVLIPLLFMGDVVGRLFREFAITLAVAILISAVVSLTLTPMMCARLLRHVQEEKQGRFYRVTGKWFDAIIHRYGEMLNWVLDLTIEDRVSRTQYQFTLEDANPDELASETRRLVEKLSTLPQLADVVSDLQDQGLQAYLNIDRDTAARLGITPAAIDNALYSAFGQRLISTIFTQANQYRVVLEVKPEFKRGPAALNDIYVTSAAGGQVPLSAVATVSEKAATLSINHIGQCPATTISVHLG